MNETYKKFLKIFLPVLFMVYLGGIITFTHVHIENGITIVHSHPYKTNGEHHHHTGAELQLLHQISTIVLTGIIAFAFILKITRSLLTTYTLRSVNIYRLISLKGTFQLRAPPVLI